MSGSGAGARAAPSVDGVVPAEAHSPESVDAAAEALRAWAGKGAGRTVLPCGRLTRMRSGVPPSAVGLLLSTERLDRVIHYEPDDLTITIGAGCSMEGLDRTLRARGQFLPVQSRAGRGSLGGLLAEAPEGGLALGYGPVRDYVTGLAAVLADGTLVRAGGRVVKNVAGYPLHRLMVGSRGTLGFIVEASLRVQPVPEAQGSVAANFVTAAAAFAAARELLAGGLEPVFVNMLLERESAMLAAGFDGLALRVSAHVKQTEARLAAHGAREVEILDAEEDRALRERIDDPARTGSGAASRAASTAALGAGAGDADENAGKGADEAGAECEAEGGGAGEAVIRVAALPAQLESVLARLLPLAKAAGVEARVDARPGLGTAYLAMKAGNESALRRALESALTEARAVGSAIIVDANPGIRRSVDPWGTPPPDFPLMKRIKQALDPGGVFTGGRFVGGL